MSGVVRRITQACNTVNWWYMLISCHFDFCTCIVCVLVDCWRHRCWHFVPVDCISRLSGSVELTLRYTTTDIHCRHKRYECDGGRGLMSNIAVVPWKQYPEWFNVSAAGLHRLSWKKRPLNGCLYFSVRGVCASMYVKLYNSMQWAHRCWHLCTVTYGYRSYTLPFYGRPMEWGRTLYFALWFLLSFFFFFFFSFLA